MHCHDDLYDYDEECIHDYDDEEPDCDDEDDEKQENRECSCSSGCMDCLGMSDNDFM